MSGLGTGLLMDHEGYRDVGYLDSVGVATVCYGHTATAEVGVRFTQEHCNRLLSQDIASFEKTVNQYVTVPLTQPMFDSLVSFCYNVGSYNCRTSTMFRILNQGDYVGAGKQFDRWVYAKGRDCRIRSNNCYGVYSRRMAEKALFLSGIPDEDPVHPRTDSHVGPRVRSRLPTW